MDSNRHRLDPATVSDYLRRCQQPDGGYAPSPDPSYPGNSDTGLSDIAAPAYAAVLARTLGFQLPDEATTVDYLQGRQRPDGSFAHRAGRLDPESDLAILYNTTQAVVGLRALGATPLRSPPNVLDRFFERDRYRDLPWYTTSFFPLFYAALDAPFPERYRQALSRHMVASQGDDGYLGDHVAATFHMAHFYRLIGEPTPSAEAMVRRTLRDQTPDGGWNIREPDWDVHACFDAAFIRRQLGGDEPAVESAIQHAASWAWRCRVEDGGFGHFPGWHSDVDALYFQVGTLYQAGWVPDAPLAPPDPDSLGWGHAMRRR